MRIYPPKPMTSNTEPKRYIFRTAGVCPPEIHFKIHNSMLCDIRFVGGGCPGNAQLVGRLLEGRPADQALKSLEGIDCRNNTSCPDQLAKAIADAVAGNLEPAQSFKVHIDESPRTRVAVIGRLDGSAGHFLDYFSAVRKDNADGLYGIGNITGPAKDNAESVRLLRKEKVILSAGELDWQYANSIEPESFPGIAQKERDFLLGLPHVLSFQIGPKKAVGFFGDYIRHLPDFSDFDPFALEMNMVCDLSRFLKDETVFPALEAMIPQFSAQIVLFSQPAEWGHRRIGDIDFISVGNAFSDNKMLWGLMEIHDGQLHFKVRDARTD